MSAAPIPRYAGLCVRVNEPGSDTDMVTYTDHAAALAASEARNGELLASLRERQAALEEAVAGAAESEVRVKELEVGIVHRGDDVIMPEHLYLEINASGVHWKARAEAAEQSLAAAIGLLRQARGWINTSTITTQPSEIIAAIDAIDALLPKGEGATS